MTVWNPTAVLQHVYCFVQCSLVLGTLFDTSSLSGLWNAVSESKKKADLKWLCKQSFRAQLHFGQQEIETTSRATQRWQYGFFTFKSLKKQQKLGKMYKFWQQKLMEGLDLNVCINHLNTRCPNFSLWKGDLWSSCCASLVIHSFLSLFRPLVFILS